MKHDGDNTLYTHIKSFDNTFNGFRPGELTVIAGRPAMGKTSFMISIINNYLETTGQESIIMFSLKQSKNNIINRLSDTASNRIIINDTEMISVENLCKNCIEVNKENRLKAIIVDYLQLLQADNGEGPRFQQLEYIMNKLKELADMLKLPIIVLSTLSRSADERENHTPRLSDLREGDIIEKVADNIFFIYRKGYYEKDQLNKGVAEIISGKSSIGANITVRIGWEDES